MSDWKRFIYASDLHGDEQDVVSVKALLKHVKEFKPEIRVFGGDLWDLRPFRKKASNEEKRDKVALDLQLGTEFIYQFKPTVFIRGNHDERLWDLASYKDGPLSELAQLTIDNFEKDLKKLGCNVHLPWERRKGIYKIGHLHMTHGFKSGINAAREMARVYGNIIFGHNHYPQYVEIEGLEPRVGVGAGCLCNLDMDFQRGNLKSLAHNNGWVSGVVNVKTGEFRLWPVERVNDKFMIVTGYKEI